MATVRWRVGRFPNGLRCVIWKTSDYRCRVPARLPEEITALCTRCFNCYPLRRHCGVGFVLQILKILSDRHKIGAPWHRLALVDLMSVKLCRFIFSASTCNTRKRNQGSNWTSQIPRIENLPRRRQNLRSLLLRTESHIVLIQYGNPRCNLESDGRFYFFAAHLTRHGHLS